jgi:AraC-like DNA-binding protein
VPGCLADRGSNSSWVICSESCKSCWARHGSRVAFCSRTRAPASLSGHVAAFGRIVDFDAEFNGIACAAEDLAGPLPSADPVMARYARQYLDAMISRPDMTLADKVRWLVREMLPLGRCSVEKVAQHLGVDRRTVHRHLARSGETFSSLVDDVRGDLAEAISKATRAVSRM